MGVAALTRIRDVGLIVGNCEDDTEKKLRAGEIESLWTRLIEKDHFNSTEIVLHDSYNLIREALNCYGNCAYMATASLCRSAVETGLHRFTSAESLQWVDDKNIGLKVWTYSYGPCHEYLQDYGNAYEELKKKFPTLFKKINKKANKIRKEGNFVAHYSSTIDRQILISKKLWIGAQEAYELLVQTIDILGDFMNELARSAPKS